MYIGKPKNLRQITRALNVDKIINEIFKIKILINNPSQNSNIICLKCKLVKKDIDREQSNKVQH